MNNSYLTKGIIPSFYEEFSKEWNEVVELLQGMNNDLSKILIVPKEQRKRSNSRWTREEIEKFYELKQQQYRQKEIAQLLGKSVSAVAYLSKISRKQEKEKYERTLSEKQGF